MTRRMRRSFLGLAILVALGAGGYFLLVERPLARLVLASPLRRDAQCPAPAMPTG